MKANRNWKTIVGWVLHSLVGGSKWHTFEQWARQQDWSFLDQGQRS